MIESVERGTAASTEGAGGPTLGRRLGGHFAALLGGAAAVRIIALATQIVLARLLGPEAIGALAVASALLVFSGVFTDGGLTAMSLRDMVRDPGKRNEIASATLIVQVALACAGVLLLVALATLAPWRADTRILIIAFSPALMCSALNMSYVLKSADMLGSVALFRLVATAVPAVLSISLVAATREPVWVAVSQVVGLLVSGLLIYVTLRSRVNLRLHAVPGVEIRATARRGTPLLLTGIFLVIPTVAGPISVYAIDGAHSAGVYYAAWQLSFAALTVAALVVDAIYPEMVRHAQRGREDFGHFTDTALRLSARATLPLAVGVTFAADEIIRLLFGSEFGLSAGVLRIVVWIVPVGFCWVILGHALIAVDAEKSMTRRSFLVSVVTVVACPLGAYWYGPEGTAIAAVSGSALQLSLYAMSRQMRPLRTLRRLLYELPYALVPVIFCVGSAAWSSGGLLATAALTVAGLAAAELMRGLPTVRMLKRAGLVPPGRRPRRSAP